ncbi:unnamed protein product [Moneuplotes crassus]|uniref:Uncharacterized protein n=2 Tax=Euplotes crassus TaxID=5936 RepID=A0AAD1U1T6_EUPCR|nr:unnamed protein product [Moneuplotes crassus]
MASPKNRENLAPATKTEFDVKSFIAPLQPNMIRKRRMSRKSIGEPFKNPRFSYSQKQVDDSNKSLSSSNSVLLKKDNDTERMKDYKFNSYKRMNNRVGRELLRSIKQKDFGITRIVPEKRIEDKINYYYKPHHKKCHLSNPEDIDYEEAEAGNCLNLSQKASKKWIDIANLVLKSDKKELRKCLKMMKYGLFQNYKKVKDIQRQDEYIRNQKIEITKKLMACNSIIDSNKECILTSHVGYIDPVIPKSAMDEESSEEGMTQTIRSFLSRTRSKNKQKEVIFQVAPGSPEAKKLFKSPRSKFRKRFPQYKSIKHFKRFSKFLREKRNSSNLFHLHKMGLNSRNLHGAIDLPGIRSCDSNEFKLFFSRSSLSKSSRASSKERNLTSRRINNILVSTFSQRNELDRVSRESSAKKKKCSKEHVKIEQGLATERRAPNKKSVKSPLKLSKLPRPHPENAIKVPKRLIKQRSPSNSHIPRTSLSVSHLRNIYCHQNINL